MPGTSYWIVACSAADESREGIATVLRSRACDTGQLCEEVVRFDIPQTLKFSTFDDLIRLVDDFGKHDTLCETVCRKIERHLLDIDPNAEFKIMWQRNAMSCEQYIRKFVWDDSKYPRSRPIRDNLEILLSTVSRSDEEVRAKASHFTELKSQESQVARKEGGSLLQRDLIDVLTPDKVEDGDFLETEHITTVVIIVPRGAENEWLSIYESLENFVIPRSAKRFPVEDKEGNSVWRVMAFKSVVESFKGAARQKRFMVRDFKYSEDAYKKIVQQRANLAAEKRKQEAFLARVAFAAFSDVVIAWVHLKAMRVFVESVLRFGVPPNFAAFFLKPHQSFNEKKLRQQLESVFTSSGTFGHSYIGGGHGDGDALLEGSSEYYPYVSLSMTLLSATAR